MSLKEAWPAVVALALAIVAVLAAPDTRARRIAGLDLGRSGFPDTFLMRHRSDPERCRVVRRHASTMRRYDEKAPGRYWDCRRLHAADGADDAGPPVWLVQSKRLGRGTVFFVPARAVSDWAYPFLYGRVRASHEGLGLPAVGWTQLHLDRVYSGLYLRVALPFDLRRKDGGSGTLRELLLPGDDGLRAVDTRLAPAGAQYREEVDAGRPPVLAEPHPALVWLARRNPAPATPLLLGLEGTPRSLTLLPLPLDLADLAARRWGRPLPAFEHPQLERRVRALETSEAAPATPLDPDTLAWEFERYADALAEALRADAALYPAQPALDGPRQHRLTAPGPGSL